MNGRSSKIIPEYKGVRWKMDLLAKFSGPGGHVVDFCAQTMVVAKACPVWPERSRFARLRKDEISVIKALAGLVEVYSRRVFSSKTDLAANGQICSAAGVPLAEMNEIWT